MKYFLILFLILLATFGCNESNKHIIRTNFHPLTTEVGCNKRDKQIIGAILPPLTPEGWIPTKSIIEKAQPVILNYIQNSDKEIYSNLENYRCQYIGIIVDGKKRIYCNLFWLTEDEKDWEENYLLIYDDGICYFQLEYDIETEKCLNFSINGEA